MSTTGHRPGAFKHINKKHKSGHHRTKGAVDAVARGECFLYVCCFDYFALGKTGGIRTYKIHRLRRVLDVTCLGLLLGSLVTYLIRSLFFAG